VINLDDPYGRRLAGEHPDAVTFGLHEPADYGAREMRFSVAGAQFVATTPEANSSFAAGCPEPSTWPMCSAPWRSLTRSV